MNKLLKVCTLLPVCLALVNCGGDAVPEANQPTTLSTISKRSSAQAPDPSAYYDAVQKIYVGYFGRPADVGGLAFVANRFAAINAPTTIEGISQEYRNGNADVRALIDMYGTSQESADLYPGDNGVFMDAVYRNLFSRDADLAGKAFWVNALNLGLVTRAEAAVTIMAGSQGSDVTVVNKKAAVAAFFTASLQSELQQIAYNGLSANVFARSMISNVVLDTDTTAFQASVASTISNLVNTVSPEGLYFGKLTGSNVQYQSLILENGQYWGFYSQGVTGRFAPTGVLQGMGSQSGGSFSGNLLDMNQPSNPEFALAATYFPQRDLQGSLTSVNGAINFTNAPVPSISYNYATPASTASIEGAWTFTDAEGYGFNATVVNGDVTATASGCAFGGNLAPRASGKNVFNAALTYGAGNCRLANSTVNGAGYTYLSDEGSTRQLIIGLANGDRSEGSVIRGARVTPAGTAPAFSSTDLVVGTGNAAVAGNVLTVHYTGWLYNGNAANLRSTRFESSLDSNTPFAFTLGASQVISGWDQGVVGMRVGGKRLLILPAAQAYGNNSAGAHILPNASLVFEVQVIGIR